MPRPKRTKVASTAPRVVKPSISAKASAAAPKPPISRSPTAPKPVDSSSESSDGFVVKSTRPQREAKESQDEADYTMTGALPVASESDAPKISSKNRTPLSRTPRRTRTSKGSTQVSSGKNSSKVVKSTQPGSAQKDASHVATEEGDSSGFGDHLLSFTSLGSDSPAHGTRPPSAIKVGATPAHERSILALTNFKRRARQPSLLRMVHQTTDMEDNDQDDQDDLDLSFGDLDDFHPNAESTPLLKKQSAPENEGPTDSGVNVSSSGSRGTKRKLSPVVQVPRSSPPYDPPSGPDVESRSPSPSLPDVVRSTVEEEENQEDAEPEIYSETMAPPMSSSDYVHDEIQDPQSSPVVTKRSRLRAAPAKEDGDESEGEDTGRTRQTKGKHNSKSKANGGISTAKLQALLPKRKTRRFEEDLDSDTPIDPDEDELSMPPRRHAALARKYTIPKASKKATRATKKPAAAKTTKGSRTYGRRGSSDKENDGRAETDEDSDESGDTARETNAKPSSHLAAIAKQFEDIDAFDLDFESVSYVQTSSSPRR